MQAFITLREYGVNNKDPKTIVDCSLIKPNYLDDISPVLKEIRHWAGMRCVELIDLYGWHDIATALGVDSEAQVRQYYNYCYALPVLSNYVELKVLR